MKYTIFTLYLLFFAQSLFAQSPSITSKKCPYSCALAGLSDDSCREWRVGNKCYVEDLSSRDNSGVLIRPQQDDLIDEWQSPDRDPLFDRPNTQRGPFKSGGHRSDVSCRDADRSEIAPPRINIIRVKGSDSVFGDHVKVIGSVEGKCLSEAGLFENGQKTRSINVSSSREFKRFEFEVLANKNSRAEIRVYNSTGDSDIYQIDTGEQYDPYNDNNDRRYNW